MTIFAQIYIDEDVDIGSAIQKCGEIRNIRQNFYR